MKLHHNLHAVGLDFPQKCPICAAYLPLSTPFDQVNPDCQNPHCATNAPQSWHPISSYDHSAVMKYHLGDRQNPSPSLMFGMSWSSLRQVEELFCWGIGNSRMCVGAYMEVHGATAFQLVYRYGQTPHNFCDPVSPKEYMPKGNYMPTHWQPLPIPPNLGS